jgi:2-oxoglutarate ferredoxin oxidoreductase subunit delta
MARIKIDKDKCKGCMLCVSVCSRGIIVKSKRLNRRGILAVDKDKSGKECTGCAMCAIICPDICIEVYK